MSGNYDLDCSFFWRLYAKIYIDVTTHMVIQMAGLEASRIDPDIGTCCADQAEVKCLWRYITST